MVVASNLQRLRVVSAFLFFAYSACGGDGKTAPPGAGTMAANSQTSITAVAGTVVSPSPSVIVSDENGNPFAGATVDFTVTGGGGAITGASVTTNASGVATVGQWTLGKTAGPNTLTATSGSLSVTFNATGVAGPASLLTISGGDNQTAPAGSAVSIPPAVLVQDANGNPKAGVTVTFAVGDGGGSVSGATATSNATGVATVGGWILGGAAINNTLVATTAGAPSVTFHAVASSKCNVRTTLPLGSTISGALEANDCAFSDGSFVDFFSTVLPAANAYLFTQAGNFDSYLDLALADGTVIAENDDASETTANSAIKALLPAGTYVLGASSLTPAVTGNYSVSAQTTSTENANCELVFAVKNISTNQHIATTDCLWTQPTDPPIYADGFYILLRAGQSITVDMTSTEVDSYLEIVPLGGTSVAQNDNKDATTKDARLTFTATATNYYAIVARTAVTAQTGAYTLSIQ